MTAAARIGLLGGTFDPVHFGHLDAAEAARQALALDEVVFVPSHVPPHRPAQPRASSFHRFALLSLAIEGRTGYRVSDLELARDGRIVHHRHATGLSSRRERTRRSFSSSSERMRSRKLPRGVSFLPSSTPRTSPSSHDRAALSRPPWLRRLTCRHACVVTDTAGRNREVQAVFPVEARTRDISATAVHARIIGGLAIDDLVPRGVAQHIASNHLYKQVDELHG